MIMLAGYVDMRSLLAVMCMPLFAGLAHNVHAGVACTDAFGADTAASQGCGAAYKVSDVSGGGTYRAADPNAMPDCPERVGLAL
jgi:hypothetical protein